MLVDGTQTNILMLIVTNLFLKLPCIYFKNINYFLINLSKNWVNVEKNIKW